MTDPRTGGPQPPVPNPQSPKYTVMIADRMAEDALAPLAAEPAFELVFRTGLSGAELADALADVDAVIVRSSTTITADALARAGRLKVIGRAGVGVDNIDVGAATERGVAVLNAPSGNTISAAELTMALLLALVRRVPAADRSMRAGDWDRTLKGSELHGKTLGLVGAGRIGGEVARRARAFGMDVVAHDPFLGEERARKLEIRLASLDDVLASADVLSLHVPLTDATAGLLDEDRLRSLKPGVFIVNAARGGVIDEAALVRLLDDGHIAGAALDVFETEPLSADHPLRGRPDVVLTPHLGAATAEAQQNVAREIAEAVRAALVDGDFARAVNAPAIGGEEMRRLRPMLELAQRLGSLAAALSDGGVDTVEVRYAGTDENALRPLVNAAAIGFLDAVIGPGSSNFVNALHLLESRGLRVERVQTGPHGDYAEYVEVALAGQHAETRVAGAMLAEGFPRIVRIGEFHVDIVPRGTLLVLHNRDVPGVIGHVGTLLGDAGVNIAEYHQARLVQGGEALAAISVDGRVPDDALERLGALPDVRDVRQVGLG
ncbi:MAG: phosphoglycerate dehydrogenase [Longimicrobiales bacterium]